MTEKQKNFLRYTNEFMNVHGHNDNIRSLFPEAWDEETPASRESRTLSEVPSRENIRRIIELTASIESDGSTYGMDTNIGDVEDLIDRAEDILRGIAG